MPIINKDNIKDFEKNGLEKNSRDNHYDPQVAKRVTAEAKTWMNFLNGMLGSSSSDLLSDYETEDTSKSQNYQRYTDYKTFGFQDLWNGFDM